MKFSYVGCEALICHRQWNVVAQYSKLIEVILVNHWIPAQWYTVLAFVLETEYLEFNSWVQGRRC